MTGGVFIGVLRRPGDAGRLLIRMQAGLRLRPVPNCFPRLSFGVLSWTDLERHYEQNSYNARVCTDCEDAADGLVGHGEKSRHLLGPVLVLEIAVLLLNVSFMFLLLMLWNVRPIAWPSPPPPPSQLESSEPVPSNFQRAGSTRSLCPNLTRGFFLSFQSLFSLCHISFNYFHSDCPLHGRHLCLVV